jgi:hypothetical protein
MSRWSTCLVALVVVSLSACNPAQKAKEAKNVVDDGNAAACTQERSTIEKAVEAYTLLTPDAPVSEAAMVTSGFIHAESVLMDIGPDGAVVPAPGSVCA